MELVVPQEARCTQTVPTLVEVGADRPTFRSSGEQVPQPQRQVHSKKCPQAPGRKDGEYAARNGVSAVEASQPSEEGVLTKAGAVAMAALLK